MDGVIYLFSSFKITTYNNCYELVSKQLQTGK